MSADQFVREGRPEDAADIARLQVRAWRSGYAELLPADTVDELTGEPAWRRWREQWQASLESPPTSRHRVLVATDAGAVVGFAAIGPATDDDRWPRTDGELYTLHVDPDHTGAGHGSRLINAVADTLRDDGFSTAFAWVLRADTALASFLGASGWQPDGATAELDIGVPLPAIRLHVAL